MRTGAVLTSDQASRYQALGALGQPVFHAHVQLKAAIAQRLGPGHAACFARPDRDPRDDTVRWVADIPGTPRRWTELAPDEQARLALTMEAMRAEFRGYIAELRAAPANPGALGTTPQAFAAMLEQALHIPGPEHLHVVGDQPVFSFWGFHQPDAAGIEALGLRPGPAATPAGAPAGTAPPAAVVATPWWRRWWWWLALLLLLLLLALALLGPWGCAEKIGLMPAKPTTDKPDEPKTAEPPPAGIVPVAPGSAGPGAVVPGSPGAAGAGSDAPGSPPPPSGAPPPDVPETEPPKPEAAPEPPAPPEQPKPPEPPPPPKPMEIPPDAAGRGDVGFLDGEWKSRRGLVDQLDGKPLEQFYRFDEKGKGETVVRRADGVECRAPAEARFDGGKLTVEEKGSPTCPDGRSYGGSRTECERTATGVTVCRGVNPDGTGYRVGLDKVQP